MIEQFVNDAESTLDDGIDDSQTTLAVVSAAGFPTSGNFRIRIGDELLLVTGVSSTTFTVVRGVEGTTPASHGGGASVTHVLTAASLRNAITQIVATELTASDFTGINSPTTTDLDGGIVVRIPPTTSSYVMRGLAYPYTAGQVVTICYDANVHRIGNTYGDLGVGFRDSSGGKCLFAFNRGRVGVIVPPFRVERFSAINTTASMMLEIPQTPIGNRKWFRLSNVGGTLKFEVSVDGEAWVTVYTEGQTAYLANPPDQVYIAGANWASSSNEPDIVATLRHWHVQ